MRTKHDYVFGLDYNALDEGPKNRLNEFLLSEIEYLNMNATQSGKIILPKPKED